MNVDRVDARGVLSKVACQDAELERMNRQRAEYHGGNHGKRPVEGCGVQAKPGPPRERARVKVQPGFRR